MRGIRIVSALAWSTALSTWAFAQDDPKKLSCADYCLKICQTKQDKNKCMSECPNNCATRRGDFEVHAEGATLRVPLDGSSTCI